MKLGFVCYYFAAFGSLQSVCNDMYLYCSPLLAVPVHSGFWSSDS